MATVRIVTDSGVALPPDFIREHRIEVIPHRIRIGSAIYAEDDSFSVEELLEKYRALDRSDVTMLPTVLAADINTIIHSSDWSILWPLLSNLRSRIFDSVII